MLPWCADCFGCLSSLIKWGFKNSAHFNDEPGEPRCQLESGGFRSN